MKIAILPGDGIGTEIVAEAVRVVQVLDLPLEQVSRLGDRLEITGDAVLPCPGQALVLASMPCAGLAGCGVCALRTRRGWRLACEDGPVFPLQDLLDNP